MRYYTEVLNLFSNSISLSLFFFLIDLKRFKSPGRMRETVRTRSPDLVARSHSYVKEGRKNNYE